MITPYLVAIFAVLTLFVAASELLMPALMRRDLLFGVTVAADARDTAAGRAIIRSYRLGVVALTVAGGAILAALSAFAPAGWWTSGALVPAGVAVALLPLLPYFPAHRAARRLAAAPPAAADAASALPAAELRPRRYSEDVPWVWEALPLVLIAATVASLAASYATAPAIIPIDFDANGQPTAYAAKTIASYFFIWVPMQLGVEVLLTVLAILVAHAKALPDRADAVFRRRGLRYLYAIKALTLVLLGGLAAWMAQAERIGHANVAGMLSTGILFTLVIIVLSMLVVVRTGQGGARLAGASPVDRLNDRSWRLGVIYINRADPAIVVERRYNFGWTLNLGNPLAWALLGAVLAVPLGIVTLALVIVLTYSHAG